MTIRFLAPVNPLGGSPEGPLELSHPMRLLTRAAAFHADAWTAEQATEVRDLFDRLASDWDTRNRPERFVPIVDALERGGPFSRGLALELGSGTGIATSELAERFPRLVAVDLSMEMLRLASPLAPRLRADGARLPFRHGAVDTLILINMLLFPVEVDRVLATDGALVWVNTSGPDTPIYLPAEDLEEALPGEWDLFAAQAGRGTWAVARRASAARARM